MAATERRNSISLLFGLGRQETKPSPLVDGYPKLRHKLQKVTKQLDTAPSDAFKYGARAPAPDIRGVQAIKVPGEEFFLSTKYESSRPLPSRDTNEAAPPVEKRQSRRDSMTRSLFRSLSSGRVPSRFRSTSLTRAPTVSATATQPSPSADETDSEDVTVGTAITTFSVTVAHALRDGVTGERRWTAPSFSGARRGSTGPLNMNTVGMAAHGDTAQVMEERGRFSARIPPSASRTSRLTLVPRTLSTPSQQQANETTAARPIPQFHRPYSQPQQRSNVSAATFQPSCTPHDFATGLIPTNSPMLPLVSSEMSPLASSATSNSSSASSNSLTPAAISASSESLTFTVESAITNSYSTLSTLARNSGSSCATPASDGSVNGPLLHTLGQEKSTKFDFDNESSDGEIGSEYYHIVPGSLNMSGDVSPTSPTAGSFAEVSLPITKPRRRVKTPVYAIGQLETGISAIEARRSIFGEQDELSLLQSKSSIECIAEEYRALLASRNSLLTDVMSGVDLDTLSSPASTYLGGLRSRNSIEHSDADLQAQEAINNAQRQFPLVPPGSIGASKIHNYHGSSLLPAPVFPKRLTRTPDSVLNGQSPLPPRLLPILHTQSSKMSFNRNSTSNSIMAAYNEQRMPLKLATPPPPPADKLALQICVDLLTRELSAAVLHRSSSAAATTATNRAAARRNFPQSTTCLQSPEAATAVPSPLPRSNASSALQILVMIEAYEQLRDQLVTEATAKNNKSAGKSRTSSNASTEELETLFSLWLSSLYRIYDSLTGSDEANSGTTHNYNGNDENKDDELHTTSDGDYVLVANGS
ncbi:hypothetical protein SEPCBS57363_001497 [Sporothrix epigloea]|uniref:Cyclic nucleotide-binding domain-containing protein n=1 Tax=Sporothrix epigloea TaxID=1892477 RepID=A0ABP0DAL1_9PEZI